MSAPTDEKVARMLPSANTAACIKKGYPEKYKTKTWTAPYDFLLFIASV